MSGLHHQLLLQVGQGMFFVPTWSSQNCKTYLKSVNNEHLSILGIPLGSIEPTGQDVGLIAPLFYCFEGVWCFCCALLLLNKPAWFCGWATWLLEWSLTYRGLLYFFYLQSPSMAPHSSTVAWKIPWMEEPGRLQSMGSLRVGHDWATSLSLFSFMHWRRKWQPTPVFLPGESQGWGSLVCCRLWGRTELDTTEAT